jgi:transposase
MVQEGRDFSEGFKTAAVALLASGGRPLLRIAGELGISPWMARNWGNRPITHLDAPPAHGDLS